MGVIAPRNIIVIGGGGFLTLMKMSCRDYPIQHICQRCWWILISYEDKVDVITPFKIFARGVVDAWSLMKIS